MNGRTSNVAAMSSGRRIQHMSSPQLVAMIRRLLKEATVYKLLNGGKEMPTGPLFQAALDEAKRRHITINHPELE